MVSTHIDSATAAVLAQASWAAPLLACAALAAPALGQEVSLTLIGSPDDYFGAAVDGAGDVDGDGFDDLVVGSYLAGGGQGRVEVFSGRTGDRLRIHAGAGASGQLGGRVAGVGDVNGDGFPDYAGGARLDSTTSLSGADGVVRVYSGLDGTLLHVWTGPTFGDQLGTSLDAAGDVNGDGFADVIAGAPQGNLAGAEAGLIRVFSGATGAVLFAFNGDGPGDQLGVSVAGAGDVNGDGFDDFMAGAIGHDAGGDRSGLVRVYSGATGDVLHEFSGTGPGDQLGVAVCGIGDVDGDGFDDFAMSSFDEANAPTGTRSGNVKVYSGRLGTLLYTTYGAQSGDWFGLRLDAAGDVNADGVPDIVAGSYRDSVGGFFAGGAYVLSGADGEQLLSVHGGAPQNYVAWDVAGVGDTDGDGLHEIAVGTLRNGRLAGMPGTVTVYGYQARSTGIACMGEPNSTGLRARLDTTGTPAVAQNSLTLVATDLPARSSVVFLNSRLFGVTLNPAIGSTVSSGHLCLSQSPLFGIGRHRPVSAGGGTTVSLTLDLMDIPSPGPGYSRAVTAGETWYWQGWYRDRDTAGFSNFTDAIVITFE